MTTSLPADKAEAMETRGPYEARLCKGIPSDCCDYGIVSLSEGREVCRVWREQDARAIAAALSAPAPAPGAEDETLQARVHPWMMACFGREISADRVERGDRLLEEVFELLQSGGYDPARVIALREYVWGREAGEPFQEVGGVMITLAAYCLAHGISMHEAGEAELARIWTKVEKIRAKQAAKPVGSALPVAAPQAAPEVGEIAGLVERLREADKLYNRGPNYEPLTVPASAIRLEAATALTALSAKLAEVERQAELRLVRYLAALKRAETAEAKLEEARNALEADLFWDDENPEESYRDVEDIFDAIGEAATFLRVRRAVSLPDAWVSGIYDDDGDKLIIAYHETKEDAQEAVRRARALTSGAEQ